MSPERRRRLGSIALAAAFDCTFGDTAPSAARARALASANTVAEERHLTERFDFYSLRFIDRAVAARKRAVAKLFPNLRPTTR